MTKQAFHRGVIKRVWVITVLALGLGCAALGCTVEAPATPGPQAGSAGALPAAGMMAVITGGMPASGGTMATAGTVAPPATGGTGVVTGGVGGVATGGVGGVMMTGGMGGAAATEDAAAPGGPALLPTTDVTMDGPYTTMVDQNADGGAGWVFRPTELGANGEKHPVLVWGCGSGSNPMAYMFHMSRIASHGFVVYASISSSVTGALLTRGIDFMFAENERSGGDFFGKLDMEHLAVGGHSLGSLGTYDIADDPRIFTTIHVDGAQFDGMGGQRLMKPAIFICGDASIAKENCDNDYMGANVPIFYTQLEGLSGIQGHIQAARVGIDVWVAWMRWQLAGEEERSADFLDPSCTFCTGMYTSMQKNFM